MAWVSIPNNTSWEYDNAAVENDVAGTGIGCFTTSGGVRTYTGGEQIYISCRTIATYASSGNPKGTGEISKTYYDNQ